MAQELQMPSIEIITSEACESIPIDIFLLTAVDIEFRTLLASLKPPKGYGKVLQVPWVEDTYFVGICGLYTVALAMCDKGAGGRAGSTLTVSDAIARWKPHAVIMVGFAFGAKKEGHDKQEMGDILVSTQVIQYEIQRVGDKETVQRGSRPECGQILLNRVRTFKNVTDLKALGITGKVHFGPVLAGDKLVDNADFKTNLLRAFPDAIGGEMEGGGLYAAAERKNIEWILIKSIADWAVGKTDDNQAASTDNAVKFVVAWLGNPGLERQHFNVGVAELGAAALARHFTFQQAAERIRNAESRKTALNERVSHELKQYLKDGRLAVPLDQKPRIDELKSSRDRAIEDWLNTYSDLCSLYLNGRIDAPLFRDQFSAEIRELFAIDGPHKARLFPRETSVYTAIWRVWDELSAT